MLQAVQITNARLVKSPRQAKALQGLLCEESEVLVSWGWRIACDLQKTWTTKGKHLLCWSPWCWSTGAEKLAVIKKSSASLRWNLLQSISWELACRTYASDMVEVVPCADSWALKNPTNQKTKPTNKKDKSSTDKMLIAQNITFAAVPYVASNLSKLSVCL